MALSAFGEWFKLEVSEEVMPDEIYTEDNLVKEYVSQTEAIEAIKKSIEHKSYKTKKQEQESGLAVAQLNNYIDKWDCREMMSLVLSNVHPNIMN